MYLPWFRPSLIFCLFICTKVVGAAPADSLEIPPPLKTTIEAAQVCFENAGLVPEFRYEESVEISPDVAGLEERELSQPVVDAPPETDTDTDTDTDTEDMDPCALAIQNNNLSQRDLAASYSNQGIIHSSNGNYAMAIISHTQAVALIEDSEQSDISESIYINRGNTFFAMQEYEAANADYSRVILLSAGTRHQALYNRALVFKALGYTQRALEELEHALLLAPDNPRYQASHSLLITANTSPEAGLQFDRERPGNILD